MLLSLNAKQLEAEVLRTNTIRTRRFQHIYINKRPLTQGYSEYVAHTFDVDSSHFI